MSSNISTGVRWIIVLLIYFTMMTLIVSLVTFTSGGSFYSDLDLPGIYSCSDPRLIYSPYSAEYVSTDDLDISYQRWELSHTDCSKTEGVLSESRCNIISGCNWTEPDTTIWVKLYSWVNPWSDPDTELPSCFGDINMSYYDIDTSTTVFGVVSVDNHNNSNLANKGSVCTHPIVINNETLCDMFSCTWYTKSLISELEVDNFQPNIGLMGGMWHTIKEMFMFRFTFGTDDTYINYFLNFFLFWLPMLMLIGALYMTIPFI